MTDKTNMQELETRLRQAAQTHQTVYEDDRYRKALFDEAADAIQALTSKPAGVDWQHVANEWADVATNSTTVLENVRDGINTFVDAIAYMKSGFEHCRRVQSSYTTSAPNPVAGGGAVSFHWHLNELSDALGHLSWYDSYDNRRTNADMSEFLLGRVRAARACEAKDELLTRKPVGVALAPEGYDTLVWVNLDDLCTLVEAMDRLVRKGDMPHSVDDAWQEFDYLPADLLASVSISVADHVASELSLQTAAPTKPDSEAVSAGDGEPVWIPDDMVDHEGSVEETIDKVIELYPSAHRAALLTLARCFTHPTIYRYMGPHRLYTAQPTPADVVSDAELVAAIDRSPEAVSHLSEEWCDEYAEWRRVAIRVARSAQHASS